MKEAHKKRCRYCRTKKNNNTTHRKPSFGKIKITAMSQTDAIPSQNVRNESGYDNNQEVPIKRSSIGDETHIVNAEADTGAISVDTSTVIDISDSPFYQQQPNDTAAAAPEPDLLGDSNSSSYHGKPSFTEHLGNHRQYWRDMVLGVNDGLVSTFLLIAGVSGGGLTTLAILLTGISGGVAGAISMASGEFMATKSQEEVFNGEIKLEGDHIEKYKRDEMLELKDLLARIGLDIRENPSLVGRVMSHYETNDEALLKAMIALEFGIIDDERRKPWKAGAYSFFCFILGSLPSIIPFAIVTEPLIGLLAAGVATCIGLLVVGVIKTWATRGSCFRSALENLLVALLGGGAAYGIGLGFEKLTK